ncbi:hypothetical protein KFK09_008509 [Dendrobium nobile]|uniref:Uncharacterized protein n=1 Tax=Dendrobium nobile TaxID=94219 RepID=A0A8T3BKW5_DENNO|nr:hypothetical protein KFK09_008509 [Dendrobium nobile]
MEEVRFYSLRHSIIHPVLLVVLLKQTPIFTLVHCSQIIFQTVQFSNQNIFLLHAHSSERNHHQQQDLVQWQTLPTNDAN